MEIIKYPDGQISIKSEEYTNWLTHRFNNYEDMMSILGFVDIQNRMNKQASLFIPCFLGQRSDRVFSNNQSFDLKIICNIFNYTEGIKSIAILDPHSDVLPALLDRCIIKTSENYVKLALACENDYNTVMISPDAGAYKKVFKYGESMKIPVIAANKYRDEKGEINLTFIGDIKDKNCLIVDDYCDGGYTFTTLAKKLKEQGAKRVALYISHGLFSKGLEPLKSYIDHVYCTNSIKDIDDDFVTQFKVI